MFWYRDFQARQEYMHREKWKMNRIFRKIYLQNLKYNVKSGSIFNLILVGVPSSLILSIKNIGSGFILLNRQNLLAWQQM